MYQELEDTKKIVQKIDLNKDYEWTEWDRGFLRDMRSKLSPRGWDYIGKQNGFIVHILMARIEDKYRYFEYDLRTGEILQGEWTPVKNETGEVLTHAEAREPFQDLEAQFKYYTSLNG